MEEHRERDYGPRQYRMPGSGTTAGAIAGAITVIAVGAIGIIWPDVAGRVPFGFESAVVTLVTVTAAYLKREKRLRRQFEREQHETNNCVDK